MQHLEAKIRELERRHGELTTGQIGKAALTGEEVSLKGKNIRLNGSRGVTASANGIENIERGFNNYKGFDISEMRDYRNIKIFRFEVINDASKKIKRVYVKELNQ